MELSEKEISARLKHTIDQLPENVQLVAVSKTHPASAIQAAYNAGQRRFGENKVQEMTLKHSQLPSDIEWHFIGHVQKNKIRQMAPYVSVIQGIDSLDALVETDRQAKRCGRRIKCLLQIHVAREESKFGFTPDAVRQMLAGGEWKALDNVCIAGVMGMATNTDNEQQVLDEFQTLVSLFKEIKETWFSDSGEFSIISAGMSDDHELAIRAGSNMVRIGSAIFGERDYAVTTRMAGIEDIPTIQALAEICFRHTYRDILSPEQMEYMMEWMYSSASLNEQMLSIGHVYYLAFRAGKPVGYVSVSPEGPNLYHLQKIYVLPDCHGAGIGRTLFQLALDHVRRMNPGVASTVELNVNRNNKAVDFYRHMGMTVARQGDFPIGNGYYMNDYIMSVTV